MNHPEITAADDARSDAICDQITEWVYRDEDGEGLAEAIQRYLDPSDAAYYLAQFVLSAKDSRLTRDLKNKLYRAMDKASR